MLRGRGQGHDAALSWIVYYLSLSSSPGMTIAMPYMMLRGGGEGPRFNNADFLEIVWKYPIVSHSLPTSARTTVCIIIVY